MKITTVKITDSEDHDESMTLVWCKPVVLYHQRGRIKWCEDTSSGVSCRRAVMLSSTRDIDARSSSVVAAPESGEGRLLRRVKRAR